MARIVYTWELGNDYGHIGSFMPLAHALRARGHEVIFAVRDLHVAEKVAGCFGFHTLQAPLLQTGSATLTELPHSYADILLRNGFYNQVTLTALVRGWCTLFSLLRPAVVIADHSPSSLLAARGLGLRRAAFGTGFCAVPPVSPVPAMRYWDAVPAETLLGSEQHVLGVANSVLTEMKGPPMQKVADLFEVSENFLCTFAELDHYPNRSGARYWGPFFNIQHGTVVDWPAGSAKCIFAYIKPFADFDKIMTWLASSGYRVLAYAPGLSDEQRQRYQSPTMLLSKQPINISHIVEHCDLAILHAGHGTMGAMLLAGVPLFLLPLQLEQGLAALRAANLGVATMVDTENPPPDYAPLLEQVLANLSLRQNAKAFAAKYAAFSQERQVGLMLGRIEEILIEA